MKELRSLAEIQALPGWAEDNLVVKDRYRRLEAKYTLPEEVKCRLQKDNGNPCSEGHLHGWVVESADGSLAMVGGKCALTHFGADSTMAKDVVVAENVLDLQRDVARAEALLRERNEKLAAVTAALKDVLALKDRLSTIRETLGKLAWRALEDLGRANTGTVRVTGVRREIYDADDELIRDGYQLSIGVGTLRATSLAKPATLETVASTLRSIATAFRRADLELLREKRSKDVKLLTAALSQHGRAILDAQGLLELGRAFESNDFTLLCFKVKDRAERYKVAKAALRLSGRNFSSDAAKNWVIDRDTRIKEAHNVDRLDHG